MPSIKASSNPSMNGWTQQPQKQDTPTVDQTSQANEPPVEMGAPNQSPFMLSSMPLMASTNDALNQFYGNWSIPQFRTVPIQHGGSS